MDGVNACECVLIIMLKSFDTVAKLNLGSLAIEQRDKRPEHTADIKQREKARGCAHLAVATRGKRWEPLMQ